MKLNKFKIASLGSTAIFDTACGSDHKKAEDAYDHIKGDGHNDAVVVEDKEVTKEMNKYDNDPGQSLDSTETL